jgi:hypothetical protein
VLLIITSQVEWKQHLISELESTARNQKCISSREEFVKDMVNHTLYLDVHQIECLFYSESILLICMQIMSAERCVYCTNSSMLFAQNVADPFVISRNMNFLLLDWVILLLSLLSGLFTKRPHQINIYGIQKYTEKEEKYMKLLHEALRLIT